MKTLKTAGCWVGNVLCSVVYEVGIVECKAQGVVMFQFVGCKAYSVESGVESAKCRV